MIPQTVLQLENHLVIQAKQGDLKARISLLYLAFCRTDEEKIKILEDLWVSEKFCK